MEEDSSKPSDKEIQENFKEFTDTFRIKADFDVFVCVATYLSFCMSEPIGMFAEDGIDTLMYAYLEPQYGYHTYTMKCPPEEAKDIPSFPMWFIDENLSGGLKSVAQEYHSRLGLEEDVLKRRVLDAVAASDNPSVLSTRALIEEHKSSSLAALKSQRLAERTTTADVKKKAKTDVKGKGRQEVRETATSSVATSGAVPGGAVPGGANPRVAVPGGANLRDAVPSAVDPLAGIEYKEVGIAEWQRLIKQGVERLANNSEYQLDWRLREKALSLGGTGLGSLNAVRFEIVRLQMPMMGFKLAEPY